MTGRSLPKQPSVALSADAANALRRLVADSIATGRTSWNRRMMDECGVDRPAEDELATAGLTFGRSYGHVSLTAAAVALALWEQGT